MKRAELALVFLQLPLDFLALLAAALAAYGLRFAPFVVEIRRVIFALPLSEFTRLAVPVVLGWIVIFALVGLYRIDANRKFLDELRTVAIGCTVGFAAITIAVFLRAELFNSRFIVLAGWIFAMAFVSFGRLLIRFLKALLYRSGIALRRVAVIGDDRVAGMLMDAFKKRKGLGYAVVARFDGFTKDAAEKIAALRSKGGLDEVLFTNPKSSPDETLSLMSFCEKEHLVFKYSADLFAAHLQNMVVSAVAGIPIVELRRTPLEGWGAIWKRLFDLTAATLLLLIFLPLILLISFIILVETGRPAIFRNERVGLHGKKFSTFKFRSMKQEYSIGEQFKNQKQALAFEEELIEKQSIKNGPVYKIKNDPRVTLFGRFLRRWSLDELPQLWNVIRGDMSLVGPRPHQPREVARYADTHPRLMAVRPGITGMAQISGRSDLTFEDEARLDTFYIENWSPMMDIIIMLKTPFIVLVTRGSY